LLLQVRCLGSIVQNRLEWVEQTLVTRRQA